MLFSELIHLPSWFQLLPLASALHSHSVLPAAVTASDTPDDAHLLNQADPIASYALSASLDPVAHTMHGEGTLTWRNASDHPVREVWLHLYLNAYKNERSAFFRESVGGFRGGRLPDDWGAIDVRKFSLRMPDGTLADCWQSAELKHAGTAPEDETDAHVSLPREVLPGETVTFEMVWDDKIPAIVERTGYQDAFHMMGQWFPKIARLEPNGHWAHFPFHRLAEFYADYGTYDVRIDVPESFSIAATGSIVESRHEGGRIFERRVQENVHDFAWAAWDQWIRRERTINGVAVTLVHPPGSESAAEREWATLNFAIPYYQDRYGPYPYPVLTVVHPPADAQEAGGMEYPTLITTGGSSRAWARFLSRDIELVTIHEFGHQYFYGLLGSNEVQFPFLDEGLNSYAQQDSLGKWLGPGSMADWFGITVSNTTVHAMSWLSVHNAPVAQAAYAFNTGSDYGRLVYARTAAIVETLHRVYGDDAMREAMGRYARVHRFRHPDPEDFLGTIGVVLGERAADVARTALFDRGWVDYVVTDIKCRTVHSAAGLFDGPEGRTLVKTPTDEAGRFSGWVLVTRQGTLKLPVDIELVLADGSRTRVHWNGEEDAIRIPYDGTVALTGAIVDPDRTILIDQNRTNNHASVSRSAAGGTRWSSERLIYWAQLLLQTVAL